MHVRTGAEPSLDYLSARDPSERVLALATMLWGAVLSTWLTWLFFRAPPDLLHWNHEGASYIYRLVEFVDCLRAGQPFPQWASDFRGGLGSPYFGYYQPGFFYVASAFTLFFSTAREALGGALWLFSLAGFLATAALVRARFGGVAGVLAGSALLLSHYPRLEIYVRGDLSEYAAMMTLPIALCALTRWLEDARPRSWSALALASGALVVLHAGVGLIGYGFLTLATLWYAAALGAWHRGLSAVGALLLGMGLVAFYWFPVAFEWSLASGDRVAYGPYHYGYHFIDARQLLGWEGRLTFVSVDLEPVVPALAIVGLVMLGVRRGEHRSTQRRLVGLLWTVTALSMFLMTPASQFVWERLPLLRLLQFPWRLLVALTVATAMLAGCQPLLPRVVAGGGILALLWWAAVGLTPGPLIRYPVVHDGADLRGIFFVPDLAGEWLPPDAQAFRARTVPRELRCIPECERASIDRGQGWIRVRVTTEQGASVVVPQYFFPAGWRVTLDGQPVETDKDPAGLLRVTVPPVRDGVIEARFHMTPMRRLGVAVSAVAFVLWLALVAMSRDGTVRTIGRRRPSTSGPR
ncbi:MAG TPA: hypothetical protein VMS22_14205 [Candidatus Eisenbacteria bacterium]|nr:hypothetical protein [Candidatus Eisenbacteria bacterium]